MKTVKRLLITAIVTLPVMSVATAVAAYARMGGSSLFGLHQPELPQD